MHDGSLLFDLREAPLSSSAPQYWYKVYYSMPGIQTLSLKQLISRRRKSGCLFWRSCAVRCVIIRHIKISYPGQRLAGAGPVSTGGAAARPYVHGINND